MAPKLYGDDLSPVVRSVYLVSKAIGLKLEEVEVNLAKGDHLTTDFLKINPQHTVPSLVDDDFAICDSHAINTYLIGKYAKDDSLYPKDLKTRAVIDERLHFHSGVLFAASRAIIFPILGLHKATSATSIPQDKVDKTLEAYTFLETFLEGKKYIAGNQLTLADLQLIPTLSQINVVVPISEKDFPRVTEWWNLIKTLPYYKECNQVGLDKFTKVIRSKLA